MRHELLKSPANEDNDHKPAKAYSIHIDAKWSKSLKIMIIIRQCAITILLTYCVEFFVKYLKPC